MSGYSLRRAEGHVGALLAQPWLLLAARIALTSAFWLSGITKALDFPSTVAEVRGLAGMEPAALIAALVIVVQLGGSLLVIWGDAGWAWRRRARGVHGDGDVACTCLVDQDRN